VTPLAAHLHQVEHYVRRFVVLSTDQLVALALWVAHTHAFGAATATPYLYVSSAEMESGKTRLLEVLRLLVAHPWFTGRTTAAALTRKIDKSRPRSSSTRATPPSAAIRPTPRRCAAF
jgi:hypothetical protein